MGIDLRKRLRQKKIIRSLGAHDVYSAMLAEQEGFETIFIGGFGATASLMGLPDLNILTVSEMATAVQRMAQRLKVPLIADGDTGHGGVHNVTRTVREFEKAGAAGMILEDQLAPKRCGHFQGKHVIPAESMITKIKAAVQSRQNKDFVLIARTDARDVKGLSDAIRRVKAYHQAGADIVFIESPHTKKELEIIPKRVKAPILVNMLTGGKTPNLPIPELEKMGYKIVVYPIESLLMVASSMRRLARAILKNGSIDSVRNEMINFSEVKEILGLPQLLKSVDQ